MYLVSKVSASETRSVKLVCTMSVLQLRVDHDYLPRVAIQKLRKITELVCSKNARSSSENTEGEDSTEDCKEDEEHCCKEPDSPVPNENDTPTSDPALKSPPIKTPERSASRSSSITSPRGQSPLKSPLRSPSSKPKWQTKSPLPPNRITSRGREVNLPSRYLR